MPYWGGGTFAARGLRANEMMYYALMGHARSRGCTRFDFGRSKLGTGPFSYKKNWGFEPRPLFYARWLAPGETPPDTNPKIGSAHVCMPVTYAHLVCRLLLQKNYSYYKLSETFQ